MRKQKTPSIFMKYLEYYVNTYMPEARGLSKNTINSYKTTFTLLIKYMYSVKNMKADEITFGCLDVNTLSDFMSWLEHERKCSVTTRNLFSCRIKSCNQRETATIQSKALSKERGQPVGLIP